MMAAQSPTTASKRDCTTLSNSGRWATTDHGPHWWPVTRRLERGGDDPEGPEEPQAAIGTPEHRSHGHHGQKTRPQVGRRRQGGTGVTAQDGSGGGQLLRTEWTPPAEMTPEIAQGGAEIPGHVGRPQHPAQMGGSGQEEPDRVGQEDRRHRHRHADPHGAVAGAPAQLTVADDPGVDDHEHRAEKGRDAEDEDHLRTDEEFHGHEHGQHGAHHHRPPPLPDVEFVEAGHHRGNQRQTGQVQPAEGQLHDHQGREPVGQSAHEGGRRPPHPASQQPEHRQRRQRRDKGGGHVHGRHRSGQDRDGGQDEADGRNAGVGQQVQAHRVEEPVREEELMAVAQGEGRPGEIPDLPTGIGAVAGHHRRGTGAPDVPPEADGQQEVEHTGQ